MSLEVYFLLLSVVISGLAAGSETALVSASRIRLRHLASRGRSAASLALGLLDRKERILAVTLIITNLFHIAGGAVATKTFEQWLGTFGPIVATVSMTCVLLILSEIVPKAYFRHHADQMLVAGAPVWKALSWVLAPVTLPVQLLSNLLSRLPGQQPKPLFSTREEIRLVVEESAEGGGLDEHEQEMLASALDYARKSVREVMVPIAEVALLPETSGTEDLLTLVRQRGHTRIPLYRERVDRIVGLVTVFDVLYDRDRKPAVQSYARSARLVPDSKRINALFLEMQRERESLAVVVNEFGACIGIITLEDIIEELFGDLTDEHEDATPEIREETPGRYRVNALADIDDVNEETGFNIPKAGYETIGGYVLYLMGRIPREGESFTDGSLTVRVLEADRYSVRTVELKRQEDETAG
jgi:putative hemolysin